MTAARSILDELRARGAIAYRRGAEVRMRPASAITPELLELLPPGPPDVGAPLDAPDPWIVSAGTGGLRLLVAAHPATWPDAVFRCAALVEVLAERTRADLPGAQVIADELETLLTTLRRQGIEAWLCS